MKLIGISAGECVCCGKDGQRIFLVQQTFANRTTVWPLCADCATEEQEIEHYERERQGCEPFSTPYGEWLARR